MKDRFSPKARVFWDKIPPDIQERLLDNVYCAQCRKMTAITDYTGRVESGRNGVGENLRMMNVELRMLNFLPWSFLREILKE